MNNIDITRKLDRHVKKLRLEIRELCEMEAYSLFNPYIQIFNKVFGFFLLQSQKEDVLGRNYRSSKEIVEFNNRVFSPENLKRFISSYNAYQETKPKNDAYFRFFPAFEQELLQVFSHSEQEPYPDKPAGYVSVERFDILSGKPEGSGLASDSQSREERSDIVREKLLGLIKDLRSRSFDFKDIAVLSRSGGRVEEISGWLIEEGIPVESEKTLNIRENSLIKEVVSFLKFLDSP